MKRIHAPAGYVLLAGDLAAFLLFTYYGKLAHGLPATASGIMETLAPFLLAWILVALFFHPYRRRSLEKAGTQLLNVLLMWTIAAPIGLVIRTLWLGTPLTWLFAAVAYFIMLAFLLGWRIPFAIVYALIRRPSRTL
ncbi:DUF3054 domain-containing protein [Brevibacillus borstelensis]|uniref:DUF3054 domain-containing protein n=1 Tax=Brevibacillus borstelensis TaxID=45462 RepID=UPI001D0BCCD6|nr:DUF3054 domain-containing protein [Brevibacillus borstelensis]MCC0563771.1 DUF3054 domain-containing protein [Brevibacillus borstelensis]MCM3469530.1 DUF3054 domain-containing protein [Brevibacillus borstelensis]MCM3559225.1 DUF3054 domain-containing protein [Brevibacillus borstelensis]MCM3589338.1 DUF3054 domain-containing protein [Brevibacillus borstelensis]MED1854039.1 DUF3054 domain-containing protein [Brevibacillus borstelensis]